MRWATRALAITLVVGVPSMMRHQQAIPVRTVSAPVGTDSGVVFDLSNIRPLSDGRVWVNDDKRKRIILLDSALRSFVVVSDTSQGARRNYDADGVLIPFVGDSTVLLDGAAQAFVVLDPNGGFGRAMAGPSLRADIISIFAGTEGSQGFDPRGRLVYVGGARGAPKPLSHTDSGTVSVTVDRESRAILRFDPDSRTIDTMASIDWFVFKRATIALGGVASSGVAFRSPIPTPDEWVLLPDGSVAVVRSHDYHIDWVSPDRSVQSTSKMAFDWRPISPSEKQRFVDSLKALAVVLDAAPVPARPGFPALPRPRHSLVMFEPDELPDYYPPVRTGQVRADAAGNVWILPTTSNLSGNGLVYDVVNRKGEVVERVRIPEGRRIIAVGKGVVYMSYTPKGGLVRLERARVNR